MTMTFNVEDYVHQFKKKKKFTVTSIKHINAILISEEYYEFIKHLYKHLNSKSNNYQENLDLINYKDAENLIDQFWEKFLGNDLFCEFKSALESKLKM